MVTPQGFNALLKIVEEPPEHVKFIFATTEPEKVIGTIRWRTHHYPFRLVPPAQMLDYVQQLCEAEKVSVQPGVLPLVVRAGGGSVRDTLSLLDQLIAGSEGNDGRVRARGRAARLHARRPARRGRRRARSAGCRCRVLRRRSRHPDRAGSAAVRRRPARAPARPHRGRRDARRRRCRAARHPAGRARQDERAGRRLRRRRAVARGRCRQRCPHRDDRRDLAAAAPRAHGRAAAGPGSRRVGARRARARGAARTPGRRRATRR